MQRQQGGNPPPIPFQLVGNRIAGNKFSNNGAAAGTLAGDVTLEGGVFGESVDNCLVGNHFTTATFPEDIESGWGCQHMTTPSPGGEPFEYILELSAQAQARTQEGQPAPPAQPTMPNPCAGVPKNPLCTGNG